MSDRRPEDHMQPPKLFVQPEQRVWWLPSWSMWAGWWGTRGVGSLPDRLALTQPAGKPRWTEDVGRGLGHCHAETGRAIWEWQWRGAGRGAPRWPSVGWRGVQEDLVGSRKMRKVEVVAVLQLDTKPKGKSFWSSTACRQLLLKPLLAVGPAVRASCGTASAKEGL